MACLQSNVHILPKLAPASWGYRWDLEEGMGNLGIKAASFISMHETKSGTALSLRCISWEDSNNRKISRDTNAPTDIVSINPEANYLH